ncbi:MAG: hypothetical protein IIC50_08290 [Planctomycetes bacterium]|nr:hypothetical protein [Planctomycetota bacterium]
MRHTPGGPLHLTGAWVLSTLSFKMPVLALKLSAYAHGVSKLHGKVSRELWGNLWPGVPANEVPIKSITNGVHAKT